MSRHEGVSCDSCLKSNFSGRRYKCLICYDYDLCADCFEEGVTSTRHLVDHPMQCILTRSDIELYFGGEMLNTEQPQSFTCPYCKKLGFSDVTLLEHVTSEHTETSLEVVCPVCAGLPGGEPNLVTDDFAGHLMLEHRQGPRELISFLDEPSAIRHGGGVRRMPARTLGGQRTRRSNMHFSSSGGLSALSPSGRESVDPIAELLSQLSGMRRGGPQTSQLQQLQMQIQLERQVTANRQQLERLPRRSHQVVSSGISNSTMAEVLSGVGSSSSNNSGVLMSGTTGFGSSGNSNGNGSMGRSNEWSVNVSNTPSQQHGGHVGIASHSLSARDGVVQGSCNNAGVGMLAMPNSSNVGGAAGSAYCGGHTGDGQQSQFLLAKFMHPKLSDEECSELEHIRSERASFVHALLLSTLADTTLNIANSVDVMKSSEEWCKLNSDDRNSNDTVKHDCDVQSKEMIKDIYSREEGEQQEQQKCENVKIDEDSMEESIINNNATNVVPQICSDPSSNTTTNRAQVHQQQQTSPEDFNNASTKKKTNYNGGNNRTDRDREKNIERRSVGSRVSPAPSLGSSSSSTGGATSSHQPQQPQPQQATSQHQELQQQKIRQNISTTKSASNQPMPDSR